MSLETMRIHSKAPLPGMEPLPRRGPFNRFLLCRFHSGFQRAFLRVGGPLAAFAFLWVLGARKAFGVGLQEGPTLAGPLVLSPPRLRAIRLSRGCKLQTMRGSPTATPPHGGGAHSRL